MQIVVVLGLIASIALAPPAATAHIVITVGNDCTAGTVIDAPVHSGIWIGRCEFNHDDPSPSGPPP